MDYFRAIVKSGEISERVYKLTTVVINQLPSNYNAYYIRRKCLKQLKELNLKEELQFTIALNQKNQKVYQIWEHRRQIIEWLNDYTGELESLQQIFNEDNKNYHAWAYRVWLCEKFNLFTMEIENINYFIEEDVGNNSAWNYRYFLLSKIQFNFKNELEYIKNAINIKTENEAVWNYLKGWFKTYKFKNDVDNPYKTYIQYDMNEYNILDFINEYGDNNRFALSLKQQYLLLNNKFQEALQICDKLIFIDNIRQNYWKYYKGCINELIK